MAERIAVVGAGAVGGHVGAYMARAGNDVTLIDPWPEHVEAINAQGMTLDGQTDAECFNVPMRAIHLCDVQAEAKSSGFDIVFMSTKSYDTRWATEMIAPYLAPGGFVVSLQNAINEPTIADVVGWGRTLGMIASKISVELYAPGRITRLVALGGKDHTVFRVGECHGRNSARAERLAELASLADSSAVTTNLWGERWSKLSVNCMRNPIAAATGRGGNANDHDPATRQLSIRLAAEAVAVGRAHGYQFDKLYGLDADDLITVSAGDAAAMARCEERVIEGTKTRSDQGRASMGQDIAKGRRTEIDHLNGYVAARAIEVGLSAPLNAAIADVVRNVERGVVQASPEALSSLTTPQ